MKRHLKWAAAVALLAAGCATDVIESEDVEQDEQALCGKEGACGGGQSCSILMCNGTLNPFGECSNAQCTTCRDGNMVGAPQRPGGIHKELGCDQEPEHSPAPPPFPTTPAPNPGGGLG